MEGIEDRETTIIIYDDEGDDHCASASPHAVGTSPERAIVLEEQGLDRRSQWYKDNTYTYSRYWNTMPMGKSSMWLQQWGKKL